MTPAPALAAVPVASGTAAPAEPLGLVDSFGRRIDYLRVSVTDRCDLRCGYCMPKGFKGFEEPANWLRHDEMARLAGLFAGLGVRRLRLTGGEPLLRRGVAGLAAAIAALPGWTTCRCRPTAPSWRAMPPPCGRRACTA